jgi:hypothetical protein
MTAVTDSDPRLCNTPCLVVSPQWAVRGMRHPNIRPNLDGSCGLHFFPFYESAPSLVSNLKIVEYIPSLTS